MRKVVLICVLMVFLCPLASYASQFNGLIQVVTVMFHITAASVLTLMLMRVKTWFLALLRHLYQAYARFRPFLL